MSGWSPMSRLLRGDLGQRSAVVQALAKSHEAQRRQPGQDDENACQPAVVRHRLQNRVPTIEGKKWADHERIERNGGEKVWGAGEHLGGLVGVGEFGRGVPAERRIGGSHTILFYAGGTLLEPAILFSVVGATVGIVTLTYKFYKSHAEKVASAPFTEVKVAPRMDGLLHVTLTAHPGARKANYGSVRTKNASISHAVWGVSPSGFKAYRRDDHDLDCSRLELSETLPPRVISTDPLVFEFFISIRNSKTAASISLAESCSLFIVQQTFTVQTKKVME